MRIYDLVDRMECYQRMIITPFFSPEEARIASMICGKTVLYQMDGGYQSAQRLRFAFLPYEDDVVFPTICLKASYASSFSELTHRDVLGALMNLGIKRETLGDLIVDHGNIYIFADAKNENYISCNLTQIKRCHVHFRRCVEEIKYEQVKKIETKIISSLRLDVFISAIAHVSRGKAADMIKAGLVKVNDVVLEQTSYLCDNNTAISIRGIGRFEFLQVVNTTKKDHFVVEVARYL